MKSDSRPSAPHSRRECSRCVLLNSDSRRTVLNACRQGRPGDLPGSCWRRNPSPPLCSPSLPASTLPLGAPGQGGFTPSASPTPASVPQDNARRRGTALTAVASSASAAVTKVTFSSPAVGQEHLPLDWFRAEVGKGRPVPPGRSCGLCPADGRCPCRPQCAAAGETGVAADQPAGDSKD